MQRSYRLKKGFQFNYIYRKGKSVGGQNIVLLYAKNKSGRCLCGFSVSKKLGKAVVRNKTKRRLKESFAALYPSVDKGYNYIVVARVSAAEANFQTLSDELKRLLVMADKLK